MNKTTGTNDDDCDYIEDQLVNFHPSNFGVLATAAKYNCQIPHYPLQCHVIAVALYHLLIVYCFFCLLLTDVPFAYYLLWLAYSNLYLLLKYCLTDIRDYLIALAQSSSIKPQSSSRWFLFTVVSFQLLLSKGILFNCQFQIT